MFSSLSRLRKPRLTGPDFKKEPVPMGARLMRVEPGGGAASADGFFDRPAVEVPNLETVSGAWCREVLRLSSLASVFSLYGSTADLAPFRDPGRLDEGPFAACPSCDVALFALVRTLICLGAGAGVMTSCFASRSGVGSLRTGKRCGYGPDILIERFADADPFAPICTTLGGVLPLPGPSLANTGELFRMILIPGARLGVSAPALLRFTDRLKRGTSYPSSCFGGDDGTGASSRSA